MFTQIQLPWCNPTVKWHFIFLTVTLLQTKNEVSFIVFTWETRAQNLHEFGQVRINAAFQYATLDLKRAADFPVTEICQTFPNNGHILLKWFCAVGGFRGATFYGTGRDVLSIRSAGDIDELVSRARQRYDVEIAPKSTGHIWRLQKTLLNWRQSKILHYSSNWTKYDRLIVNFKQNVFGNVIA